MSFKRIVLLPIGLFAVMACATWLRPGSRVITIHAQTLPVTKTVAWDANIASDAVTLYTLRLDGTVVGTPVTPQQVTIFTTAGLHTLTVTATNLWGTSAPTTLTVNVVVPAGPQNLRIQ